MEVVEGGKNSGDAGGQREKHTFGQQLREPPRWPRADRMRPIPRPGTGHQQFATFVRNQQDQHHAGHQHQRGALCRAGESFSEFGDPRRELDLCRGCGWARPDRSPPRTAGLAAVIRFQPRDHFPAVVAAAEGCRFLENGFARIIELRRRDAHHGERRSVDSDRGTQGFRVASEKRLP